VARGLLLFLIALIARGDVLDDAARALARKVIPHLAARNLSSLSDAQVARARSTFVRALPRRGARATPVEIALTVSENTQGLLLVAEIRKGGEPVVEIVPFQAAPPSALAALLPLTKRLVWEQEAPIPDLAVAGDRMIVLDPEKAACYERGRGEGTEVESAAVTAPGNALVIGARRLDAAFLKSLGHAPGMRALLWLSPREVFDADGPVRDAEKLTGLAEEVQRSGRATTRVVRWASGRDSEEAFSAVPLQREGRVLGVLLAGASLREQWALERAILWIGFVVGGSGILLGVLPGVWTTERITRPVERPARRLAHELKNPFFPLQITIENLLRA
jgi:hypothetical protein